MRAVLRPVVIVVGLCSACATSGVIAPAHPFPASSSSGAAQPAFEVGSHLGAEAGAEIGRASSGAYLRAPLLPHVELLGAVHSGADASYGPLLVDVRQDLPRFAGMAGGGGLGVRASYPILPALVVGVGVWGEVDFLARFDRVFPRTAVRVEAPVAERLYEDLWVYARPTVSLSAPLRGTLDVGLPSSGGPAAFARAGLPITAAFGLPSLYGEVGCPVGLGIYVERRLGLFVEGGYQTDTGALGVSVGAAWTL